MQLELHPSPRSEDLQPFADRPAAPRQPLARLLPGQRAVLDGVRVVAVGAAERAGVRAQDGAQHPAVRRLQDVRAVHFLRRAVIPTEDAHLGLRLRPLRLLAPPLHGEQVEAGEAPRVVRGRLVPVPERRVAAGQVLVRPQERDALLEIVDGERRRGARGRAAAVQVRVAVPAVANYARTNRGIVLQAQGRFERLGYRVRPEGRALVLGDKCRQAEVVVPKIKSVIIGRARVQEAVV